MKLNRKKAFLAWENQYGDATVAKDFAQREIHKDDYGNRKSPYGWNMDHIRPKSRGGKTSQENLICCHFSTNDEKANKFPVFYANGMKFEIHAVKVSGEKCWQVQRI